MSSSDREYFGYDHVVADQMLFQPFCSREEWEITQFHTDRVICEQLSVDVTTINLLYIFLKILWRGMYHAYIKWT